MVLLGPPLPHELFFTLHDGPGQRVSEVRAGVVNYIVHPTHPRMKLSHEIVVRSRKRL